jgi:hypothetical protein
LATFGYLKNAEKDDLILSGVGLQIDLRQENPELPPPVPLVMKQALSKYQDFLGLKVTGKHMYEGTY